MRLKNIKYETSADFKLVRKKRVASCDLNVKTKTLMKWKLNLA
jgi:hypothetical protein